MNKTVQAESVRCVICLSSPSTMISFDTPIDVEGIPICCATMYKSLVGLEEAIMANISPKSFKLCLSCLTQLNTCYLFQRQAVKSAETLFGYIEGSEKLNAHNNPPSTTEPAETIVRCGQESVPSDCKDDESKDEQNVFQNHEDLLVESLEMSMSTLTECKEHSQELYDVIDCESLASLGKDEHVGEDYETEEVDSVDEESIQIIATEDRAPECATCAQGMDTMASFREHFLKEHFVQQSDTKFHCTLCKRCFRTRKTLVQHLPTHRAKKAYACTFCSKSFHYQHHQKNHELTHTADRPFVCDRCPKSFTTKLSLENHKAQHGEALSSNVCDMCPLRFKTVACLQKHKLMKHDVPARNFEPHVCENCGKMLYSKSAATHHAKLQCKRNIAGPESWYIHCPVCKQQFETRAQLEQHLKATHSAEEQQSYIRQYSSKPAAYECDVCGRRFSQSVILRRHMLRHEGIKPYQCEHCQRRFAQKGTLKTHLRTHTNERPYLCPRCGASFRSTGSLRSHRLLRCTSGEV